jgi:acyl-CoA thioesterase FadM
MLTVSIWADHLGNASLRLRFEVIRAESEQGTLGDILMIGSCTLVTVDRKTLRPVRIPQLLRESIAPYLEEPPLISDGV